MAAYYTPGTPAIANTLARAENVASELTTIKAAFDKIPEQLSLEQDRAAYALDTGAADAYLVALPATLAAYTTGLAIRMKAVNANTGASTLNVDGLGVKTITRFNGDALSAGDIPADSVLEYYYDGTNFQLAGGPATITNAILGPASSNDNAIVRFNGTTGKSAQNSGVYIDDSDALFIGDTINANLTVGLTVNQGSNSNQIVALKANITTALTTAPPQDVETDDFFTISRISNLTGGALVQSMREDDTDATSFEIHTFGGQAQTVDTNTSLGLLNLFAAEHDGLNGLVNAPADANLFSIQSWSGGAKVTRLILKGDDGELHLGNATLVALDDENDIMRTRELQAVMSAERGILRTPYDPPVYRHDTLHRLGLVGEKDERGEFLIRVQPILGLLMGSSWQLYNMLRETQDRLAFAERTLAALTPA